MLPDRWIAWHAEIRQCEMGTDLNFRHGGRQSAFIDCAPRKLSPWGIPATPAWEHLFQRIETHRYQGKRVRLGGWVRTEGVDGAAGLSLRVVGPRPVPGGHEVLAFDDMLDRAASGTTDWTWHELVVDVPKASGSILVSGWLRGDGRVWFDDLVLEPAGRDAVVTEPMARVPDGPQNLDFARSSDGAALPDGWTPQLHYPSHFQIQLEPAVSADLGPVLTIQSSGAVLAPGTVEQTFHPGALRGQRVRFSGLLSVDGPHVEAGLFLRLYGRDWRLLALDDTRDRRVAGTSGWEQREIVLDVPEQTALVQLGVSVLKKGAVRVRGLRLEPVGPDVPTTRGPETLPRQGDLIDAVQRRFQPPFSNPLVKPVNLDFEAGT